MKEDKTKKRITRKKETQAEEKKVKKRIIRRKKKQEENDVINKTVEFNLLEVVIIILITGIAVSITSGLIVYNNYDKLFVPSKTETKEELKEFVEIYDDLVENYIGEVDKKKLIEYAISGMYSYLGDDYSVYLDPDDTETLSEQLEGEYTGVGIEMITNYDTNGSVINTVVTRIFTDTPAQRAGLKPGDVLTKVDGEKIIDSSFVADKVKKGDKSSYEITYERDGEEYTVTLVKEKVQIDSVTSSTYDEVGYIKIDTFSNVTSSQVRKALESFGDNVTSVVIDVRDNTGGYLQSAYNIADLFVDKGKVIYELKDRNENIEEYKANFDPYKKYNKIVVLINGESASASEVLALALRESADATIVGTKSFGKGTVQDTKILESGAMVKYTSAYWLSPFGNSINKVGIEPDVTVEDSNEQLNEAIKAARE